MVSLLKWIFSINEDRTISYLFARLSNVHIVPDYLCTSYVFLCDKIVV